MLRRIVKFTPFVPFNMSKLDTIEQILHLILHHKGQGRLCYIQINNCGCGKDRRYPRLGLLCNDKVEMFAFGAEKPCCAYIITDVMEISTMMNHAPVIYMEVPGYMDKFEVVSTYFNFHSPFI